MSWVTGLHHFFAKLHGTRIPGSNQAPSEIPSEALVSAYIEYAEAVAKASAALQTDGKDSKKFKDADVASMRLFHRVKKAQGLKMPRRSG